MKKSLYISIVALVFSIAALVKAYLPCFMGTADKQEASLDVKTVEQILNENPALVMNALQGYEQKMREEAMKEANELIEKEWQGIKDDSTAPFEGNKKGDVVMVEFYDYACGYCHRVFPAINKAIDNNKNLKVIYRPLAFVSQYSEYAARAVLAADIQGKFKELHHALFEAEQALTEDMINEQAKNVGIDIEKMKADMNSSKVNNIMETNNQIAEKAQIGGVPAMIVNANMIQTIVYEGIQEAIDNAK